LPVGIPPGVDDCEGWEDVDEGGGVLEDEGGGVSRTYQTVCQPGLIDTKTGVLGGSVLRGRSEDALTLIGVTGGALVGLRSVVSLVKALVPASDSDSVVSGQVPAAGQPATPLVTAWRDLRLLEQARV
jgi:hypothetical protein